MEGKSKRTRRRYSDEEKAEALVLLDLNRNLDCPVAATANALQIPDSTIDTWKAGAYVSDTARALSGEKKSQLRELYTKAVLKGLDDILSTGVPATWRDATAIATFTDKILLLDGQATAITEHRRGVTPEQARQLLADYVASGCDEAEARALLAEDFPEAANALVN
jgi:transposase-like protein